MRFSISNYSGPENVTTHYIGNYITPLCGMPHNPVVVTNDSKEVNCLRCQKLLAKWRAA